jgi:hypothetical protein
MTIRKIQLLLVAQGSGALLESQLVSKMKKSVKHSLKVFQLVGSVAARGGKRLALRRKPQGKNATT